MLDQPPSLSDWDLRSPLWTVLCHTDITKTSEHAKFIICMLQKSKML